MFQNVTEFLPEGEKGVAKIKHLEITEAEASFTRLREVITGGREQAVRPGKYAQLFVGHTLMMSDTQMERRTNQEFVRQARGNVLIAGLGVGMILVPILKKPEVKTVLVVEKYQDVIDLVAPSFKEAIDDDRLVILREDVLKMELEEDWCFDTIYFDIWPSICGDNLPEMKELHGRFKPCLNRGGWMESWMRGELSRRGSRY